MQSAPPFLTKIGVKLSRDMWKVLYYRNIVALPFYHSQALLGCCSCLLLLDRFESGQGIQFLDKLGRILALIRARLVSRYIRPELSRPFPHSFLTSTSIAHFSMKQDQVPITQNKRSRSSQNQAIKRAIIITCTSIKSQPGNSGLSYAPFF